MSRRGQKLIPGVDTAGVLMIGKGGKWDSYGGTSDLPHVLDELQMKYGEGPCVRRRSTRSSCAPTTSAPKSAGRSTRRRWVELGVLSGLSFKLYTANRTAGALNLFAFKPQRVRRGSGDDRHCARRPRRRGDPGQP